MKKLKKGGQRSKAEEGDKVEAVQPKMEDKHSKAEKENKVEAAQPQPKKKGKRFKRKVEENGDAANSEPKKRGKHFKGKPKTEENGETEPAEKPKKGSDVLENKTVFIRNLDFDTTEEDLAELLTTFGELEYCKVCLDSYTERSRGTAFAKFKTVEAAQNCLAEAQQASLRLYIDGRQLNIAMAVPREQVGNIQQQNSDSRHKKKDKRNLYLAREGLIYPNSPAAVGVSQSDLQKRLALEERKRKLLQNLHYFISDQRLCIHNLPPKIDDQKLRAMFLNAAGDKQAKILWAKVMRNRNKANEFGNSKGYGFVEFGEHAHALKALRTLNNNPDIFTADKRPIVEFSVENLVALNRKKFRAIKSEKVRQQQQQTEQSQPSGSVEEEQTQFSGVMTKPVANDDKVAAPKLNRKMRQVRQDLRKRKRQLKAQKAKEQNLARHHQKKSAKDENNNNSRKAVVEVADKFDQHHRKRKHVFLEAANQSQPAGVKKSKWFIN